jgi:hypothetical protein
MARCCVSVVWAMGSKKVDAADVTADGQRFENIDQLKQILLKKEGESLLDRTMVFFSSNLGDASKHSVKNMPVLLAGGGFRHGQHLAFDENNHPPLCNLYVSMLERMGIPADRFGSSSGSLTGLEMRG